MPEEAGAPSTHSPLPPSPFPVRGTSIAGRPRSVPLLWLLPALLSAVLASSSGLGAAAQDAAPAATAPPTPTSGLISGPNQSVSDGAELGPEVLGHGAVRRTFTAPADGWYRLAAKGTGARWAVTVLDGGSRSVLASNRWEDRLEGGALVHARAGADLAVLVGALDGPSGGFDLEWTRAPAPVRLRPVGRLADGGRDARGAPVEMRRPGDLAFGAGRLFMASGLGLSAYARDPATGGLVLERLVDADVARALLAWDEGRSRLLAHDCGSWTAFAVRADGALGPAQAVAAAGDPAHCGPPLIDAEGGLVLRATAGGLDLFSVGESGGLRYEGAAPVPGLKGAALAEGGRAYAVAGGELLVIGWADGGRLAAAPTGVKLATPSLGRVPLAVDAGRGLLLAADAEGARLFALGEGTAPAPLDVLPLPAGDGAEASGCAFAALRPGGVVDALCGGRLFTGQWLGDSLAMAAAHGDLPTPATRTDTPTNAALDGLGEAVGMAATPDGRRVYVSTPEEGILTFERVPGEGSDSTADDHGDDPATATVVAIPSTTAGELGAGDRDYFRIDIIRAGILTFETTGSTDTYGTLYDGDGAVLEEDDDRGPRPTNFGISDVLLFEGTYFVEVKEVRGVTGAYELRVTGDARSAGKPAATAPSVSINTIPTGNEGTDVRLGATLTGGAYDGAVDYAWSVDGGTLDSPSSATPIWTRPAVGSNTNHTVRLTVTVRGTGTNAESGTSDTASADREALVRNVAPQLPAADAPSVTVNAIPAGDEGTAVRLSAALAGGTYDGNPEYAWSVSGGRLANPNSATPTWTRPTVNADADYTVRLTVTVRGRGANVRSGTSARANASRSAQVRNVTAPPPAASAPSVSIDLIPDGDEGTAVRLSATLNGGTYDGVPEYAWSVDGALDNANSATPTWTRPAVDANTSFVASLTVRVRGAGTQAGSGTSAVASNHRSALVRNVTVPLAVAAAPAVTINAIPAGNEGTTVQLSAALAGGTYDGAVAYQWSVNGGLLDNPSAATPTWTRPSVTSNTSYTVRLTVTARGSGTAARNGTSDTASASRDALVRNVAVVLPAAVAPSVTINAIPAGDESTTVQLGAVLTGGTYEGAVEYAWSVNSGALDNANAATPTWTRPSVTSDTNHTVSLTVTVRGSGTAVRSGTSDTAGVSRSALVRDVAVVLPAAAAPSVAIDAIPAGNEGTAVQLGAALTGGTYEGAVEYGWSVDGGRLDDNGAAAPTWTRPSVTSDTNHTVSLTVTVRGSGTAVRNGTSDTASASRSAQVRDAGDHGNDRASATTVAIPSTTAGTLTRDDRDYFRIEVGQAGTLRLETTSGIDTYGTLLSSDGSQITRNDDGGSNYNFRISRGSIGAGVYYLQVRGFQPSTTGTYSLEVSGTARGPGGLPAAAAPAVSIDSIPAGDEGTAVQLGATLTGGTYDGAPDYAWSVSGGALDNANLAAPTWTRPAVNADANHTVSLTVTVGGTGTNASNGSSDAASTSLSAQVRDVPPQLPLAAAPSVSITAIPAGDEGATVQLSATLNGGTYDGAAEHLWSVDGGALDNANAASPTWTRPTVASDTSQTISLTVRVRGAGTAARNGTSDAASATRVAQVRNVAVLLPVAAAPAVTINAIPAGDENARVQLGAALSGGGPYDGAAEYDWSVTGGSLDDDSAAAPTWTRPSVTSDANHTVSLTVTVRGTGTAARSGTSDTASTTRSAQVRDAGDHGNDRASATPVGIPSITAGTLTRRDRDWFRIDVAHAGTLRLETRSGIDTVGTLYRGSGAAVGSNDDGGNRHNFRLATGSLDADTYYLEVRGYNGSTFGDYSLEVSGSARGPGTLPAAAAPAVTIDAIPVGDEGTDVQLGAALTGGTYDGTPDYTWTVDGGALDNANLAAPTWTRPAVDADAYHTVSLTVTVGGSGTKASNGSGDTANASRTAQVRDVPPQLPPAAAPSVSINTIAVGDEGTDVQLGAALTGGTYDGAPQYTWSVDGGALDNANAATPTWTRPPVTSDTNHTVRLTLRVGGSGTKARNGTSDTENASLTAQVRNVAVLLPSAAAPAMTINAIPAGDEGATVQLGAALSGGTYDGTVEYDWSVNGGTLNDDGAAAPTWTRPSVSSDTNHTVSLTVTVRGNGTAARNGTSDIASSTRSAQVRDAGGTGGDHGNDRASATTVGIPSTTAGTLTVGDRDYFRIDVSQAGSLRLQTTRTTDTWGTLYGSDGSKIDEDDDSGSGRNFRMFQGSVDVGTYYLEVRGWSLRSTTGPYSLEVTGDARGPGTLPAAVAPAVTINAIAAGEEGTGVQLGATLADGTYDGAVEYDWSVNGGTLDNANAAAPTWTRPAVVSDTNQTVSLTVTVRGTGTNARNGTSDTASTTRSAQVRDAAALPAAAAPSVAINAIPDGDEGTDVQLGAALNGGAYDGAVDYAWSVSGGTLDDASAATPTWTRPSVTSDTRYTASLTVTVGGSGTNARDATSDTANASRSAQVLDARTQLPVAAAPSVSINRVATGDERTRVRLGATLNGGTYDGAAEYAWRVDDGTLDDPTSATPIWTRPRVATNLNFIVRVTVTVRGSGTAARNGTSDTAHTTHSAHVRNVGGDTHGNDWASATVVAVPSTTGGELSPGDKDYFRIDIAQAGSLTLRTTGRVDTYGALYRSYGALIAEENNVGTDINFIISVASLGAGSYYLEVRGDYPSSQGGYELEVSGTARGPDTLPVAGPPSVSINAIPAGDEGASVQLGATLNGGTYDPPPEYSWSVDSGVLDDANAATPTWTRPSVTSSANHDVRLTVRVRGYGTTTRNGTNASASASRQALVRNVASQLPLAAAPAVSINAIPAGGERAAVQLGATLTGGLYDDAEYAWSVDGGTLDNANAAAPTWTRPSVQANANHTVRLKVRVRGAGTAARSGTSATASASRSAQVRNVVQDDHGDGRASATPVQIGSTVAGALGLGDRDYFRIDIGQAGTLTLATSGSTDTFGTLQDSGGTRIDQDDESGSGHNFSISTGRLNVGTYYLEVRGWNRLVSGSYRLSVSGSARGQTGLPPVTAPSVTIDYIPAGDEHTAVQLGATLSGGTYDGTPEYEWRVAGALNDATAATPTLRRPEVGSNTTATATLIVTVRGAGTNARSGSSVSVSASRPYLVRPVGVAVSTDDHGDSRVAATLLTMRGTVAGDLGTRGDKDYFWFHLPSLAEVVVQTSGHTDTVGTLFGLNGGVIESNGSGGRRQNFKISRVLEAGYYFVEVKGYTAATIGRYEVSLTPPAVPRPPTLVAGAMPTAQSATAGGASLDFYLEDAFIDPDGDYVWLDPSSNNEAVATVALDGPALVVQPLAAGTATITVTARDPSGLSAASSFTVNVRAPTTTDPTAAFNAAGDQLTLAFTDQFAPGETRAYRAGVRQKAPRGGWSTFCVLVNSTGNGTQSVAIDLPMTGIAEPGVVYEAVYRHIGSSCAGTGSDRWSRVVQATAPGTASFDIELVFVGSPEAAHRTAVEEAVQYWERILTMSLPDYDFSSEPQSGAYCESGAPDLNDVVDDLRLFVSVTSIDGEGGTLASAGPCYIREASGLPIAAGTTIDVDDLRGSTAAEIREVIVHEIGHALGFNRANWRLANLMRNPSLDAQGRIVPGEPDAHFVGPRAVAAFNAAGGSSYVNGKVPLENIRGGRGSQDSHWRESVMGNELMTPFSNDGGEPLSAISIQAMADMGYQVDVSQAESYRLPSESPSSISAKRGQAGAKGITGECIVKDAPLVIGNRREVVLTPEAVQVRAVGGG